MLLKKKKIQCIFQLPVFTLKKKKKMLYSTGNSTQYSVMAYMGKESKKKKEWRHVQLIHCAIHLKLAHHCSSTTFQ